MAAHGRRKGLRNPWQAFLKGLMLLSVLRGCCTRGSNTFLVTEHDRAYSPHTEPACSDPTKTRHAPLRGGHNRPSSTVALNRPQTRYYFEPTADTATDSFVFLLAANLLCECHHAVCNGGPHDILTIQRLRKGGGPFSILGSWRSSPPSPKVDVTQWAHGR